MRTFTTPRDSNSTAERASFADLRDYKDRAFVKRANLYLHNWPKAESGFVAYAYLSATKYAEAFGVSIRAARRQLKLFLAAKVVTTKTPRRTTKQFGRPVTLYRLKTQWPKFNVKRLVEARCHIELGEWEEIESEKATLEDQNMKSESPRAALVEPAVSSKSEFEKATLKGSTSERATLEEPNAESVSERATHLLISPIEESIDKKSSSAAFSDSNSARTEGQTDTAEFLTYTERKDRGIHSGEVTQIHRPKPWWAGDDAEPTEWTPPPKSLPPVRRRGAK